MTMHKLTMISGVAPCNNLVVGVFVHPEYVKLIGDHLLRLDRKQHTEWSHYIVEPVPGIEYLLPTPSAPAPALPAIEAAA